MLHAACLMTLGEQQTGPQRDGVEHQQRNDASYPPCRTAHINKLVSRVQPQRTSDAHKAQNSWLFTTDVWFLACY